MLTSPIGIGAKRMKPSEKKTKMQAPNKIRLMNKNGDENMPVNSTKSGCISTKTQLDMFM